MSDTSTHEGVRARHVPDPDLGDVNSTSDDSGGWGAAFSAALDVSIGRMSEALSSTMSNELRKLRHEARQLPAMPKLATTFQYTSAAGGSITQANGTGIGVLIGGPEIGRQWNVRQVILGGTTLTATPAGVAWLLVSPQVPTELSMTSVFDRAGSLPLIAFYGTDEFYVGPNDNVWLVITAGTNLTQYVVSISYQESAYMPRPTVEAI